MLYFVDYGQIVQVTPMESTINQKFQKYCLNENLIKINFDTCQTFA